MSLALNVSEKALVDFARSYGFAEVRASEALSKACSSELALEAARPAFEALASLLSSAGGQVFASHPGDFYRGALRREERQDVAWKLGGVDQQQA